MLAGADAIKVKNLLTGEESIKDYRDFTLFLKKGSKQTQNTQSVKKVWKGFKFKVGDKVIYLPTKEIGYTQQVYAVTGNNFYSIILDSGVRKNDVREIDLEEIVTLEKAQPTMPILNLPDLDADNSQPSKKKFVSMDFAPFLNSWVSSNFTNTTNMNKQNVVKQTIEDYILNIEAVDGNQTITFDKEAEILDKIDNYIN
jgi:hypothetical protein